MSNLEAAALTSAFINSGITVLKFVLAGFSGSIALLADAWHSFSDIFSSVSVFMALRMDRKDKQDIEPAHEQKNAVKIFRRAGWETKIAVVIGLFLLFVCGKMFVEILSHKPIIIKFPLVIAAGVLILAFLSYLLYKYEFYVGKINNSPGLIADGYHSKIDMYASIMVALNLASSHFGFNIDKPVAFIICLFVAKHAWHVLIDSLRSYSQQRRRITTSNLISSLSLEDVFLLFLRQQLTKAANRIYSFIRQRLFGFNQTQEMKLLAKRPFFIFLSLIALLWYFACGFYIVNPQEEAIVEFFGRPKAEIVKPGLHYCFPFPVEKAKVENTKRIRLQVIGSREEESGLPILWTNLHTDRETFFITGDFSLLDANLYLHYNIKNLYAYFYNANSPEKLLGVLAYSHMRAIFGKKPFISIMTEERVKLEEGLRLELQRECDMFGLGLNIVTAKFKDIHTPLDVSGSFEDVGSALEDWQAEVNAARGYRDDVLPKARGEAAKSKEEASAYQKNAVASSIAEATRFNDLLEVKKRNFSLLRTQLYLETLENSLTGADKFIAPSSLISKECEIWIMDERLLNFNK
jgi:membrane protease subunit HflK